MKIIRNVKMLISIVPPLLMRKSCLVISTAATARMYHLLLKTKKELRNKLVERGFDIGGIDLDIFVTFLFNRLL
jgi:hypothetical protein